MRSKSMHRASAIVVIVIAGAVAVAAGRSPAEHACPEAALKVKVSELRAEVARLRGGRGVPDVEQPPAGSGETPSERQVEVAEGGEAPLPLEAIPALLGSRSRAEQGLGLKAIGSLALREDKVALLREVLEGGDAAMKSRALPLLKTVGGAESVALAAGVLRKDGPSWLRAQAALALGELGDAAALAPLIDASRTGDLQVRAGAVAALDRLGQPAPLQELIGTLAEMLDHPDGRMREDAVGLLSTFRTPAVFSTLAKALGDRTNSRIREAAADALGQARLAEAIPFLEGALHDSEPGVRQAAQHALDAIRTAKR